MRIGDNTFVIVLAMVFIIWIFISIRRWLLFPLKSKLPIPVDEEELDDDTVSFLQDQGYDVFAGKQRIPIQITVDDEKVLQSRIFIDYFARRDGQIYVVKLAKYRKPIQMTGSGIRELLLSYYLIYENVDGVLYMNPHQQTLSKIEFQIER